MKTTNIEPKTTALILVDLQQGIVALPTAPYATKDVVNKAAVLAKLFREKGSLVVYVRVDLANTLKLPVDAPLRDPQAPPPPASASELVPEAGLQSSDLVITKRQWGAFFGTDLEQQLRERGIQTIVMGGIATNFGVESTARAAAGLGFSVIFVEDAMTSINSEAHRFAIEIIFPKLGCVRTVDQVRASLLLK